MVLKLFYRNQNSILNIIEWRKLIIQCLFARYNYKNRITEEDSISKMAQKTVNVL